MDSSTQKCFEKQEDNEMMEQLLHYFERESAMLDELRSSADVTSIPGLHYVSFIMFDGEPILPPVMTPLRREEMLMYRRQAVISETRLKARARHRLLQRVTGVIQEIEDQQQRAASRLALTHPPPGSHPAKAQTDKLSTTLPAHTQQATSPLHTPLHIDDTTLTNTLSNSGPKTLTPPSRELPLHEMTLLSPHREQAAQKLQHILHSPRTVQYITEGSDQEVSGSSSPPSSIQPPPTHTQPLPPHTQPPPPHTHPPGDLSIALASLPSSEDSQRSFSHTHPLGGHIPTQDKRPFIQTSQPTNSLSSSQNQSPQNLQGSDQSHSKDISDHVTCYDTNVISHLNVNASNPMNTSDVDHMENNQINQISHDSTTESQITHDASVHDPIYNSYKFVDITQDSSLDEITYDALVHDHHSAEINVMIGQCVSGKESGLNPTSVHENNKTLPVQKNSDIICDLDAIQLEITQDSVPGGGHVTDESQGVSVTGSGGENGGKVGEVAGRKANNGGSTVSPPNSSQTVEGSSCSGDADDEAETEMSLGLQLLRQKLQETQQQIMSSTVPTTVMSQSTVPTTLSSQSTLQESIISDSGSTVSIRKQSAASWIQNSLAQIRPPPPMMGVSQNGSSHSVVYTGSGHSGAMMGVGQKGSSHSGVYTGNDFASMLSQVTKVQQSVGSSAQSATTTTYSSQDLSNTVIHNAGNLATHSNQAITDPVNQTTSDIGNQVVTDTKDEVSNNQMSNIDDKQRNLDDVNLIQLSLDSEFDGVPVLNPDNKTQVVVTTERYDSDKENLSPRLPTPLLSRVTLEATTPDSSPLKLPSDTRQVPSNMQNYQTNAKQMLDMGSNNIHDEKHIMDKSIEHVTENEALLNLSVKPLPGKMVNNPVAKEMTGSENDASYTKGSPGPVKTPNLSNISFDDSEEEIAEVDCTFPFGGSAQTVRRKQVVTNNRQNLASQRADNIQVQDLKISHDPVNVQSQGNNTQMYDVNPSGVSPGLPLPFGVSGNRGVTGVPPQYDSSGVPLTSTQVIGGLPEPFLLSERTEDLVTESTELGQYMDQSQDTIHSSVCTLPHVQQRSHGSQERSLGSAGERSKTPTNRSQPSSRERVRRDSYTLDQPSPALLAAHPGEITEVRGQKNPGLTGSMEDLRIRPGVQRKLSYDPNTQPQPEMTQLELHDRHQAGNSPGHEDTMGVTVLPGGCVAGLPVVTMDDKEEERHGKQQHLQRYLQNLNTVPASGTSEDEEDFLQRSNQPMTGHLTCQSLPQPITADLTSMEGNSQPMNDLVSSLPIYGMEEQMSEAGYFEQLQMALMEQQRTQLAALVAEQHKQQQLFQQQMLSQHDRQRPSVLASTLPAPDTLSWPHATDPSPASALHRLPGLQPPPARLSQPDSSQSEASTLTTADTQLPFSQLQQLLNQSQGQSWGGQGENNMYRPYSAPVGGYTHTREASDGPAGPAGVYVPSTFPTLSNTHRKSTTPPPATDNQYHSPAVLRTKSHRHSPQANHQPSPQGTHKPSPPPLGNHPQAFATHYGNEGVVMDTSGHSSEKSVHFASPVHQTKYIPADKHTAGVHPPFSRSAPSQRSYDLVSAAAKGYLTRRLLHTEKVQTIIKTIRDTAEFAINFQQESPIKRGFYSSQDRVLQDRVLAQLTGIMYDIHEIFCETSPAERMVMIQQDRQLGRDRLFKSQSLSSEKEKKVSAATLKARDRKKKMVAAEESVFGTQRPKSAPPGPYSVPPQGRIRVSSDLSGPLTRQYTHLIKRALKPITGNTSPRKNRDKVTGKDTARPISRKTNTANTSRLNPGKPAKTKSPAVTSTAVKKTSQSSKPTVRKIARHTNNTIPAIDTNGPEGRPLSATTVGRPVSSATGPTRVEGRRAAGGDTGGRGRAGLGATVPGTRAANVARS